MSNLNIPAPPPTTLLSSSSSTISSTPSYSSHSSRQPSKTHGVDSTTHTTARKMYTQEVRKAKKGSLLMRRRIGLKAPTNEGGMGGNVSDAQLDDDDDVEQVGDTSGISTPSYPHPQMSLDHHYGPASSSPLPATSGEKKKGIEWHLRLTQAFAA